LMTGAQWAVVISDTVAERSQSVPVAL